MSATAPELTARLERALCAYVIANHIGDLVSLPAAAILEGRTAETEDDASRVIFEALDLGGPHAREGNYEIDVLMHIITRAKKQQSSHPDPVDVHGERVEAIAGIFGENRWSTVAPALQTLDTDSQLGVCNFWGYDRARQDTAHHFHTALRKTFSIYRR